MVQEPFFFLLKIYKGKLDKKTTEFLHFHINHKLQSHCTNVLQVKTARLIFCEVGNCKNQSQNMSWRPRLALSIGCIGLTEQQLHARLSAGPFNAMVNLEHPRFQVKKQCNYFCQLQSSPTFSSKPVCQPPLASAAPRHSLAAHASALPLPSSWLWRARPQFPSLLRPWIH